MSRDQEIEVAQNLRPEAVPQSDIFEPNQAQLRSTTVKKAKASAPTAFASVMVSDSLTVAL
jgi:hypothetical protein